MGKAFTQQEVQKMIEDFNVYLGELLTGFGLEDNAPMRANFVAMVESQLLGGIRRWMRKDDGPVVTEQAAIELVKCVVSRYNAIRNATGQPPIFTLEDLFSKETVQQFWETLSLVWETNDRIQSDDFCKAVEPTVKEQWDTIVSRASEINVEVDIEPLVIMIVQLFVGQKSQQSFMVKLLPRAAWTEAWAAFNKAKADNKQPHEDIMTVVKKYELAILDRAQDWKADLDLNYYGYMLEHLMAANFPEIPKPKIIL